jgi:hypothetical protein
MVKRKLTLKMKKKATTSSLSKKIHTLSKLTYGCGIEHEMHIFHAPIHQKHKDPIRDVVLFDAFRAKNRLLKAYQQGKVSISDEDVKFLQSVPFEPTGRLCNGEWVIKKVPVHMPEFITSDPFCNMLMKRSLLDYITEVSGVRKRFIDLISKESITKKMIQRNGPLIQYPTGMTRYLKNSATHDTSKYRFLKKKGTKEDIVRPEYVGSYHVTFTLPHSEKTSQAEFVEMHQHFANQLQWLEPLLLSSYFSQDQFACGSKEERVRGSFRVMIIGWGNLAGSDVRLFSKGIGRYAKTPTYWRKGLKLYESEKIKPCIPPSPSALAENAITSLSSDFRTFGSTDPNRPEHRESGVGMTKPNGIEFRIFDHFHDKTYVDSLVDLISIVSENSRKTRVNKYVYKNKAWIEALHSVMRLGYRAPLSETYIQLLRRVLGIPIRTKMRLAQLVFQCVVEELYQKNYYGDWRLVYDPRMIHMIKSKKHMHNIGICIPHLNKLSYLLSFYMKLNRKPLLMKSFQKMNAYLKGKSMDFHLFEKTVGKMMGKIWVKEAHDLVEFYLYEYHATATRHPDGTFNQISFREIPHYDNFNGLIMSLYQLEDTLFNRHYRKALQQVDIKTPAWRK